MKYLKVKPQKVLVEIETDFEIKDGNILISKIPFIVNDLVAADDCTLYKIVEILSPTQTKVKQVLPKTLIQADYAWFEYNLFKALMSDISE